MISADVVREAFYERFSSSEHAPHVYFAPGRVNLIGEHTDYNDGYVLPIALGQGTTVAAAARGDRRVRVFSGNAGEQVDVDLDAPAHRCSGRWSDYVEGVARSLEADSPGLRGADMVLHGDLPIGAGLSSSAALEVATGLALADLSGRKLDPIGLARACQRAEHEYVGTRCGLMDQLASVFGREGAAVLIDCRTAEVRAIPVSLGEAELLVCNTNVKHALASSAYNARREACERAAQLLGVPALRDVDLSRLLQAKLPDELARRARHVVSENARVREAARALEAGRLHELGELMARSHASLRDDYEVSCPELDELVETSLAHPGVYGARMTGGGFGGAIIALVEREAILTLENSLRDRYRKRFGKSPTFLHVAPHDGARKLE
jgi:galactokinase